MNRLHPSLLAAAALVSAFSLSPSVSNAQVGSRITALTTTTPGILQRDPGTCAEQFCAVPGFPAASATAAGGTAYDSRRRATWISDGLTIALVDTRNQCIELCPQQPVPLSNPNAYVTGLAYQHSTSEVWVTESTGRIVRYVEGGCTLVEVGRCNAPVPNPQMLTGIAVDDARGLVYYCWANFSGRSIGGQVVVATTQSPCQPICTVDVRTRANGFSLRPLHGLGFDSCNNTLWLTDSVDMVSGSIDILNCSWSAGAECPSSFPNDPFAGLTVMASTEEFVGQPCASTSCGTCAPLLLLGGGDSVYGNSGFQLDGIGLPAGANAATVFNLGACDPVGLPLPFLCGTLHISLATPPISFTHATGGVGSCGGTTSLAVSLASPSVCGVAFHAQVVGICPSGGTFMSSCVTCQVTN